MMPNVNKTNTTRSERGCRIKRGNSTQTEGEKHSGKNVPTANVSTLREFPQQWSVRKLALALPMIIGHTNVVWLDCSLVRSVGHRLCPAIYSGLFLHCRGHPSSTHLKHGSRLCITSAWPCILWTSLQPIPPASNLQGEYACPYSTSENTALSSSPGQRAFL